MYRLLENNPARPQNSRHPARATAKRSGKPAGKPEEGAVEKPPAAICWEASDQRRDAKRHLKKWRFVRLSEREVGRFR
jgi:hypothetical protein